MRWFEGRSKLSSSPAIILISFLIVSGCAVNDHGFVDVVHYESASAQIVSLETCGVLVITNELDRGITLGCTRKAYIYPKVGVESGQISDQMLIESLQTIASVKPSAGQIDLGALGAPLGFLSSGFGLLIDLNTQRSGMTIGHRKRWVIRLPNDFSGVIFASSKLSNVAESKIFIYEAIK